MGVVGCLYDRDRSIRNRGGNVPIVLQNNQNNATVGETEVCPSIPASMGLGGGYVPMIVQTLVFDESQITSRRNGNHPTWGGLCHTLHGNADRAMERYAGDR